MLFHPALRLYLENADRPSSSHCRDCHVRGKHVGQSSHLAVLHLIPVYPWADVEVSPLPQPVLFFPFYPSSTPELTVVIHSTLIEARIVTQSRDNNVLSHMIDALERLPRNHMTYLHNSDILIP